MKNKFGFMRNLEAPGRQKKPSPEEGREEGLVVDQELIQALEGVYGRGELMGDFAGGVLGEGDAPASGEEMRALGLTDEQVQLAGEIGITKDDLKEFERLVFCGFANECECLSLRRGVALQTYVGHALANVRRSCPRKRT